MYDVGDAALVGVPCRVTAEMSGSFTVHVRVIAVYKTAILLVCCIHGHKSRVTPEFGVGDTNAYCPPKIFKKYRSECTKARHFKRKKIFSGEWI